MPPFDPAPAIPGHDVPSPAAARGAVTLFVCSTCSRAGDTGGGPRVGEELLAAARTAAEGMAGVVVRPVKCLASCSRAPTVAMSRPGGWSYLFGGLEPDADAAALVEGAVLFRDAPADVLPWRGRPDCLKRNMVGRFPPLDVPEDPSA